MINVKVGMQESEQRDMSPTESPPGSAVNTVDYELQKRKRLTLQIIAGVTVILLASLALYLTLYPSGDPEKPKTPAFDDKGKDGNKVEEAGGMVNVVKAKAAQLVSVARANRALSIGAIVACSLLIVLAGA